MKKKVVYRNRNNRIEIETIKIHNEEHPPVQGSQDNERCIKLYRTVTNTNHTTSSSPPRTSINNLSTHGTFNTRNKKKQIDSKRKEKKQ